MINIFLLTMLIGIVVFALVAWDAGGLSNVSRERKYKSGSGWCAWRWTDVDSEYILRLHVVKTPWFAVCLHWIRKPDAEPWLHDHPVSFLSLILRGGYAERRWSHRRGEYIKLNSWWNVIRASDADRHRIILARANTLTLCFMGPKTREWGFHMPEGWIMWKDYYKRLRAGENMRAEPCVTALNRALDERYGTRRSIMPKTTVADEDARIIDPSEPEPFNAEDVTDEWDVTTKPYGAGALMAGASGKCGRCGHDRVFHQVGTGHGVPLGVQYCDDRHDQSCRCWGFVETRLLPSEPQRSIYIIGSMRNPRVPVVAQALRDIGWDAFDEWYSSGPEADDKWQEYERARGRSYREAAAGYHARNAFNLDKQHLLRCDAALLVMPAGKSAHNEIGYVEGRGKPAYILLDGEPERYDIMPPNFATAVFETIEEMVEALRKQTYLK